MAVSVSARSCWMPLDTLLSVLAKVAARLSTAVRAVLEAGSFARSCSAVVNALITPGSELASPGCPNSDCRRSV